jgi:hypothetical protein
MAMGNSIIKSDRKMAKISDEIANGNKPRFRPR